MNARPLWVKSLVTGLVELAILVGVLFGVAGRFDWPAAWFIVLLFAGHLLLSEWWLLRHDPELFNERQTTAANVPQWDRWIARGNRIVLLTLIGTAALDAGRFGWSAVPLTVRAMATAAVFAGVGVVWWTATANHFLSARSRIQSERGQTVVQHGPYRFVRHPLYASRIVLIAGVALTLGSWLALIPAALNALLLALRTSWEDRLLTSELPGYREYAAHVPDRLVPGVW